MRWQLLALPAAAPFAAVVGHAAPVDSLPTELDDPPAPLDRPSTPVEESVPVDLGATRPGDEPVLGAASPERGDLVVWGSGGMVFTLPYGTAGARLGSGAGTRFELEYRTIALLGHGGALRFGWAGRVSDQIVVGVVARGAIMTLRLADDRVVGLKFTNFSLANDLEVGGDLLLSWIRPQETHFTIRLGTTASIGGPRYTGFEEREWRTDPYWRSLDFGVQAERVLAPTFSVYVRLEGRFLVDEEIIPIGFLPTGTIGVAKAL